MSQEQPRQVSEEQSRRVAEESREKRWEQPSFMREMFLGNFRLDLIHPYPDLELDREEFHSCRLSFRVSAQASDYPTRVRISNA